MSLESYIAELYGAARVPRVGKGTLFDFEIAPTCEPTVAAAFKPHTSLASNSMPDFWYSMCLNQDCAHFLQSRTRWCQISRTPTHSVSVCEGMRRFAVDEVSVHSLSAMSPKEACDLYAQYVEEMAEDVQVYLSIMRPNAKAYVEKERSAATRSVGALAMVAFLAICFWA